MPVLMACCVRRAASSRKNSSIRWSLGFAWPDWTMNRSQAADVLRELAFDSTVRERADLDSCDRVVERPAQVELRTNSGCDRPPRITIRARDLACFDPSMRS